jgi:type II secretory pathway component PulF
MKSVPDANHQSPEQAVEQLKLQLASELAPARWRLPLTRFSKRLGSGQVWTESIDQARLPKVLKNWLHAVSFCPDPVQTLSDLLRSKRSSKTVAQSLIPLIYPVSILVATFLLTSLLAWIGWSQLKNVEWYDWTRGNRIIDVIPHSFQSQLVRSIAAALMVGWLLLVGLIIICMAPRLMQLSLLIHLPWVGKLIRWSMLRDLLNPLAVLLRTGITTDQAVEALMSSVHGSLLAIPAKGLQKRISDGESLEQAIRNSMLCDEFLRPATQRLFDAQHDTPSKVQDLASLANRLFEQRATALSRLATRVCLLLVVCMYARIAVDVCLLLQGINGSISLLDFYGSSENWFLLFPIAVVNFVFLHSMFRLNQAKANTGIVSVIKLFAATCLAIALIGLSLRCTLVDLIYLIPLSMAVAAMRKNNSEMKFFAASQALLSGAGQPSSAERIANDLVTETSGGLRRRVRKFAKLISNGASCESAFSRSRLAADNQQRWLVALIARFDKMEESKSILATQSPWSDQSLRVLERLNGLKWMVFLFTIGIAFLIALTLLITWPTAKQMFLEFGFQDPIVAALNKVDLNSTFAERVLMFILYELTEPFYSTSAAIFLAVAFVPFATITWIPGLKAWMIGLWMAPANRAWTLRGIGEALESDFRINYVLMESSKIHPISRQRSNLRLIAKDLERGISFQEAFAKRKMIRSSQRGLLSLAKEPVQLAWVLRQIAARNYFFWMDWYLMVIDLMTVSIVLLAAAIVGVIAYCEFYLLATLIMRIVPS